MLAADRQALGAQIYHQAENIKLRELSNLTDYLHDIGTTGALMFGFGVAFLLGGEDYVGHAPVALKYAYFSVATMCLGSELYCFTTATFCTILAPTAALTGPRGSVHTSVANMYKERKWIWRSFAVGGLSFSVCMIIKLWIVQMRSRGPWSYSIASICTLVAIAFVAVIVQAVARLFQRFDYAKNLLKATGNTEPKEMSADEYLRSNKAAGKLANAKQYRL